MATAPQPPKASRQPPGWVVTVVLIPVIISVTAGLLFMSDSPLWWKKCFGNGFVGGCSPYVLYAQNRWNPYGASVRAEPRVAAAKISSFGPNEVVVVDGWIHSRVASPTNREPFNNDIWFHLANQPGWVSFAGIRGVPTTQDPTGLDPDGGQPAPAPTICEGRIR